MSTNSRNMTEGFLEEFVLMCSVVKWAVLASLTGAVIGFGVAFFLKSVQWAVGFGVNVPWRILALPIGGLFTGWLVYRFAPDAEGHGTEQVICSIHQRCGRVKAAVVPVKLLATVATLGVGGSAGKEGPAAQIGSGIASLISDFIHLSDVDRRKLAVCGISAGFASVFGLPIAGSIFGIEVLAVGGMFYEFLFPSFLAGITAYEIVHWLGVSYETYTMSIPVLHEVLLLKVVAMGMLIGLISMVFIEVMKVLHKLFHRMRVAVPWRPFIGGIILMPCALLIGRQYLGLSTDLLHSALSGAQVSSLAWLWKIIFVSITLGSGFSGGVITPIFVIGATAGSMLGGVFGLPAPVAAAMGMVGLVAGAANTPVAAVIMGVEMFGPGFGIYAAAICIMSYLMVGHRSIYPSQILFACKSQSMQVETMVPLSDLHPSLSAGAQHRIERFRRMFHLPTAHQHHA